MIEIITYVRFYLIKQSLLNKINLNIIYKGSWLIQSSLNLFLHGEMYFNLAYLGFFAYISGIAGGLFLLKII